MHRSPDELPHSSYIVKLLEVVLSNNHLSLIAHTIIKYQDQPWEQNWHLHMPIYL